MIAIIDYKAGNLTSVKLAFESLDVEAQITRDTRTILKADRVVFPGDGAAKSAMEHLEGLALLPTINEVVARGIPFLGICLGTQIILEHSEEDCGVPCIGLIPGTAKRFSPSDRRDKVPHMGWNTVKFRVNHPLFSGIESESEFYFIHSYFPAPKQNDHVFGETEYTNTTFASIIGHHNIIATQFHPERSGRIGLQLLNNFTKWDGKC